MIWLDQRRPGCGAVLLRDHPAEVVTVDCLRCERAGLVLGKKSPRRSSLRNAGGVLTWQSYQKCRSGNLVPA